MHLHLGRQKPVRYRSKESEISQVSSIQQPLGIDEIFVAGTLIHYNLRVCLVLLLLLWLRF